ncbi:MAG: AMP-dependent synthetase/ligase [Acidimicrobiia bacterium]
MSSSGDPGTVIGRFLLRAAERGQEPLWYYQEGGRWLPITWATARTEVLRLAAGLASLGIGPGDRVALIGTNSPDWVMTDYALQHIGAVVVPIYPSSPPDQIADILNRTRAQFCMADSPELIGRIREAVVPGLKAAIGLHLDDDESERVRGRQALLHQGEAWLTHNPSGLQDRLEGANTDDVATVVFTSGTGGDPKGAVLTHRNLIWAAEASARAVGVRRREKTLSYLPLAHAFERVITTVIPLVAPSERWTCWFVREIEQLPAAIRSVRPTIFVAVPLVWARMQGRIQAEIKSSGLTRRSFSRLSLAAGEAAVRRRDDDLPLPPPTRLGAVSARALGRRALKRIGLGRCWYAVSGAAPLRPQTQQFFQALGLPLHQGWGLTETAALCTVQRQDDLEVGVVGAPIDGVEIRLGIDGEVLVRGPNLFVGYEADPASYADVIDGDGFLHTGDVGRIAAGGRLEIVDRVKDLIITAGGRKIAPRIIEEKLRGDPLIGGTMVLGEGRPYLVALISLDGQVARDLVGVSDSIEAGLWEHHKIQQRIARTVASVNRSLSEAEQLHRHAILPFGFPDEALTPTMKLKRRVVEETFARQIDELYA